MIDVVIAGAGPNGLMLACELVLAGARPLVVEQLREPATEPKANGLVGQVVRLVDRRGLHAALAGTDEPPRPAPGFVFGALPLDLSRLDDHPLHLLPVPQRRLEQVLRSRAVELGIEVRWGVAVTGYTETADGVRVDLSPGPGAVEARFLVGADGGHSTVRRLAGIGFPGVTNDDSVSRSVHAEVPAGWVHEPTGSLDVPGFGRVPGFRHLRTERGLVVFARLPGRPPALTTVEWPAADEPVPDGPLTLAEMAASLRRVLGADVPLTAPTGDGPFLLRRLVGQNSRIAERYRAGRVFLVGDAAHVHWGIGGPGLNLGLQDAVNLGWKLAAAVNGWAPAGLLDSYEVERMPASRRVVMSTQAQTALVAPGPEVTALREWTAELLADGANARRVAEMMAGADVRYPTRSDHELAGGFAPDLMVDGVRLAELCRTARPLLVDGTGTLAAVAEPWSDRVDVVAGRLDLTGTGTTALLIRPDSYVAWASSDPAPAASSLVDALVDTFGAPSRAGVGATGGRPG